MMMDKDLVNEQYLKKCILQVQILSIPMIRMLFPAMKVLLVNIKNGSKKGSQNNRFQNSIKRKAALRMVKSI